MNTDKLIKELNPLDYFVDKRTLTLLFKEGKLLLISDFDNDIMFSFFINKTLIALGIEIEDEFIIKFNKYLKIKADANIGSSWYEAK